MVDLLPFHPLFFHHLLSFPFNAEDSFLLVIHVLSPYQIITILLLEFSILPILLSSALQVLSIFSDVSSFSMLLPSQKLSPVLVSIGVGQLPIPLNQIVVELPNVLQ